MRRGIDFRGINFHYRNDHAVSRGKKAARKWRKYQRAILGRSRQRRKNPRELSIVRTEDHRLADRRGLSEVVERSWIPSLACTFRPSVFSPSLLPAVRRSATFGNSRSVSLSHSPVSLSLSLSLSLFLSYFFSPSHSLSFMY